MNAPVGLPSGWEMLAAGAALAFGSSRGAAFLVKQRTALAWPAEFIEQQFGDWTLSPEDVA